MLSVRQGLSDAGLGFREVGSVRQPFMSVRGTVFAIGTAELQVYIYGDVGAAMRDVSKLDRVRVSPPTMNVDWIAKPSVMVANNLAAIIVTNDDGMRTRIAKALTEKRHGGPQLR